LTSLRCFQASATASMRRLRTTRIQKTVANLGTRHPSLLWTEWFSIRGLHSSAVTRHGDITRPPPGTGIKVNFKNSNGDLLKTVEVNEGDDILSIAHEHDIDLEGA